MLPRRILIWLCEKAALACHHILLISSNVFIVETRIWLTHKWFLLLYNELVLPVPRTISLRFFSSFPRMVGRESLWICVLVFLLTFICLVLSLRATPSSTSKRLDCFALLIWPLLVGLKLRVVLCILFSWMIRNFRHVVNRCLGSIGWRLTISCRPARCLSLVLDSLELFLGRYLLILYATFCLWALTCSMN